VTGKEKVEERKRKEKRKKKNTTKNRKMFIDQKPTNICL
jgi:hypothetical protein